MRISIQSAVGDAGITLLNIPLTISPIGADATRNSRVAVQTPRPLRDGSRLGVTARRGSD